MTSTGESFDALHPDLVLLARGFLVVGMPGVENPSRAERVTRVAILHVTELPDLPASLTPGGPPS